MSAPADSLSGPVRLGEPIDARPLFASELTSLLDLLRALRPSEWNNTAVPGWTVHDLAAHVLGDFHGRLGWRTPGHERIIAPGETLEAFIHRINQEWVELHAHQSHAAIVEGLELAGSQVGRRFESADLHAAGMAVSWAGADPAPAWLDIAREFTEYWTHRQQIRHATGRSTDSGARALSKVLDTFMRALPHTLRDTQAPAGTQLHVVIDGPGGGTWAVTATPDRWSPAEAPGSRPTTTVSLDWETAWRLCTRGIDPSTALARVRVSGERQLAVAACQIVSIVH
ncbi:maleylpyruvate isomerase family mycothiol-dependent enzyme [Streptomyces sp. NPDC048419]|uniref:maleylpyruvate isomerase family mycothiol-dependent enzyme n=1 Tax=Streptomyces sp. NPDC048419 TaxID=3365547 RepID=UPI0037103EC1